MINTVHFTTQTMSCLSGQSICSLLCLGYWSKFNFIKIDDLKAAALLPDVKSKETWSDDDDWY